MAEIERAILYGTIDSLVEIRNMYTAQITEVGGDVSSSMWQAYLANLWVAWQPILHTTVNFYQYEIQRLISGAWTTIEVASLAVPGTATGDPMPNQSAIVLIAKAAGRRLIGKKFFGAISEAYGSAGVMTVTWLGYAGQILLAWITPMVLLSGASLFPGILDKTSTFRPFVGGFVSSLLGTMRRRKPGVGL